MNHERAASILKELLMTPVAELDQLPRRCGLQGNPRADDLAHARELVRAIVVGLESQSGPNWDPVTTAWGAMVASHGQVEDSAMGPAAPQWVRDLPPKPGLGDMPGGATPQPPQNLYAAPAPAPPPAMAPMPAAPVMPAGHDRGPRQVARTEQGAPLPPPPGRDAWPAPPVDLNAGLRPAPAAAQPVGAPLPYNPAGTYGAPAAPAAPVAPAAHGYPPVQQPLGYAPQPVAHQAAPPPQAMPRARRPTPPQGPYQPPPAQPAAHPVVQAVARPPAQPSAPAPHQGEDIETSVAKYAAFCAACAAAPDRVFQTMVEYGVNSPQAREALDESWQDRFDDDPALQAQWEQMFSQLRS